MIGTKESGDGWLEVAPQQHAWMEVVPQTHDGQEKMVAIEPGKELPPATEKEFAKDPAGLEAAASEHESDSKSLAAHPHRRKRHTIIKYTIIGAIVVITAVLGGVLGWRRQHAETATAALLPMPTRGIAAMSNPRRSANETRVYLQDDTGQIVEAFNTAGVPVWNLGVTGLQAKKDSAIAAAIAPPGSSLVSAS